MAIPPKPIPGTELLEQPEMEEDKRESGLYCFINADRRCGADCMAFLNPPPQDQDYQGQQWACCMLLVNAHRVGKHLVILASDLHKVAEKVRTMGPNGPNIPPPVVR
jgi:hypothetical protein